MTLFRFYEDKYTISFTIDTHKGHKDFIAISLEKSINPRMYRDVVYQMEEMKPSRMTDEQRRRFVLYFFNEEL